VTSSFCPAVLELVSSFSSPDGFCFSRRVRGWFLPCHCVRLLVAPRATSGRPLLCHCVSALFCQAGARLVSSLSLREAFIAPRAGSGRSGCASGAALRPACACDRAGTNQRADPRCSPPLDETLGRGQRLHPLVWPLGARTLRRHGSCRPRGGFHHHTRSRMKRSRGLATEQRGPDFNVSSRKVGVSNRQAGASGHLSGGRGDPARGPGRGIGAAVCCGHRGAPARDALLGRGRGSLGAQRAGASKRRGAARPLGKTEPSRSEREEANRAPAWQNRAVTQ